MGELFDVVVASAVYVVRRILLLGGPMQLLSVVEWHNLISFAMDHIHGAVYVRHAIDIRKLVKWQSPSQIEHHSKS